MYISKIKPVKKTKRNRSTPGKIDRIIKPD